MSKYILIISAVYPPEPVVSARLSRDLYEGLKAKGHQVRVLHPKPTRPYGFQFDENAKVSEDEVVADTYTCARSSIIGRFWESIRFGRACAEYICKHHTDISTVYMGVWPLFGQYLAIRACLKYQIPTVTPVQDVYPESLSNKMKGFRGSMVQNTFLPIDKYVLRHSDRIHVISEKMCEYLAETRRVALDKFVVVLNWQDETEFIEYQKHAVSEDYNKFTFMYMGNIGPVAGVDILIEAFDKAKLKDSRLVIAGSGSMKERLKEQAEKNHDIEFWDVPNGKVPEIQSKADVMMLSVKKGAALSSIPSKLPAYMFSAKPILGCVDADSDTAGAILKANCGYVIEPENAQVLAEKMVVMASMGSNELKMMGEAGQKYAQEHFSKRANLEKLVQEVENVL